MNKHIFNTVFALGALAVVWVGVGFAGTNAIALAVTVVIAAIYLVGSWELRQFRQATEHLVMALVNTTQPPPALDGLLNQLPLNLQNPVRLRIEGERIGLPGPAITPYLVGLLVMLGMLGTFLGMVVTLNGAVFALEATTDLQAIRAAFASPIKGLGLAFGTSVAGVASSAMLGLMATLSRRERQQAAQLLDTKVATTLRGFSLTHQRQETFKALQQQAQAWPVVLEQMQSTLTHLHQHSQTLRQHLIEQQTRFHQETKEVYTALAQSVDHSLQHSLNQSVQAAGDAIRPIVQTAMSGLADSATALHQRVIDSTEDQLGRLVSQFHSTAQQVSNTWEHGLATQSQRHAELLHGMNQSLDNFSNRFDQRAHDLVATVSNAYTQLQATQAGQAEQQRLAWNKTLETLGNTLTQQWTTTTAQALEQQQRMGESLKHTVKQLTEQVQASTSQTLQDMAQLQSTSEALAQSRIAAEARWTEQQTERVEKLVTVLRAEMTQLRDDEAQRATAAVNRLSELQAAVGDHLTQLGLALEAPIQRLVETSAQVPTAAAEVIGQLRQEMSNSLVRDNELLEERGHILATLSTLLESIRHASTEQREVIDSLVASSATALNQASDLFGEQVRAETSRLTALAEQLAHSGADITSSAVDVSSLSEAMGVAVRTFSEANEQLITHLQRIENALDKSMARSDEQLAYYVAQAREIIDLSVTSQKEVVDELRQLRAA